MTSLAGSGACMRITPAFIATMCGAADWAVMKWERKLVAAGRQKLSSESRVNGIAECDEALHVE